MIPFPLVQWVGTIDLVNNDEADTSVVVRKEDNWATQTTAVIDGELNMQHNGSLPLSAYLMCIVLHQTCHYLLVFYQFKLCLIQSFCSSFLTCISNH